MIINVLNKFVYCYIVPKYKELVKLTSKLKIFIQ